MTLTCEYPPGADFPAFRKDVVLKELKAMGRRNFDLEFREGAVRIVRATGKPIAQVALESGLHACTLGGCMWTGGLGSGAPAGAR
jgi:transposase-like protein